MFMNVHAGNRGGRGDNAAYTAQAQRAAVQAGVSPRRAAALVNRNANTRTRTTPRANFTRRLGI